MAEAKMSDSIVIQEMLAFLQNKINGIDEIFLELICTSSFKEPEFLEAKKILNETSRLAVPLDTNPCDSTGKKHLQEIIRVFKETNPEDLATYVAKDLYKLPSMTFGHDDISNLLKDITTLKGEVTVIRKKLEISERISAQLREEVLVSRGPNAKSATPILPLRNPNLRRGGGSI